MSKVKKVVMPELDIIEFNNKIMDICKSCQEEIIYKIFDVDYKKNVQRSLIQSQSTFRPLERQFVDFTINTTNNIPLLASQKMASKLSSTIPFESLCRDVLLIFSQMKSINFQLLFSFIKIIHQQLSTKGRNKSQFIKQVDELIKENPQSWEDIDEKGNNFVFYFLYLLVNTIDNVHIYTSESDVLKRLDTVKNIYCIYSNKSTFTNDGIKNLYQQIIGTNEEVQLSSIPFINSEVPKSEYDLYSCILIDLRTKKTEVDGYHLVAENHSNLLKNFYSLFHQPTINFLNERKHNYIYNHLYIYLNTFYYFLQSKINVEDRHRYLLAGSVIKSAYNVRDCADVDFFVLDHEDNIESYSKYSPQTGVPGIFDDFGKTYYANEEFYFPMIPEMYEKQAELKKMKREEQKQEEVKNIMNNYPKFSVSGLKAGRYVDIYSQECKKIGFDIDNLDELVSNPNYRIYFLGCPVILLKLEMIRDYIKDIDLGRISRKQLHDLHFLKHHYEYLFTTSEFVELGLDKFKDSRDKEKLKKNKINLSLNIYHKDLISDEKVGYDLVIRRYPFYIEEIVGTFIKDAPLLISYDNEIILGDSRLTYQKPLLSSLPATIFSISKKEISVMYYYEISQEGEIKIYVYPDTETANVSFFNNICLSGNIKVDVKDGTKKLSFTINGAKMDKIYSQLVGQEKKYKNVLINFLKNIIQLHKMIDCHTKEKIVVDLLK